jgi:hypothetical protein
MGVLARIATAIALAAVAAPACYSPSLRDCTVSCESAGDCAGGQVCGDDRLCAAPDIAGRCGLTEVDAGVTVDASPPVDAAPDATVLVALIVQVEGKGSINVAGAGVCSSEDPHGRCTYDIALGVAQRVEAIAIDSKEPFMSWTSPTCAGQGAVCTFVPMATPMRMTLVAARFGDRR